MFGDGVFPNDNLLHQQTGPEGILEQSGTWTPGTQSQFMENGGGNKHLAVETPQQVELANSRQGDERPRIRHDHWRGRAVATSSPSSSGG